jgi:hypothetical protein
LIAQLGLWISTTCIEALLIEDKSYLGKRKFINYLFINYYLFYLYLVASQSLSYLKEAKLIWNNNSDPTVYSASIVELIDIVINISPNTEVTYCNLTLRPLTIKKGINK